MNTQRGQTLIRSQVDGAAVGWVLVGGEQLLHVHPDGGQGAVQLLHGFLRQGGLSAHDPGELGVQHQEVGAAVDQSVVVVVGGQDPVRCRGGVWECGSSALSGPPHLFSVK